MGSPSQKTEEETSKGPEPPLTIEIPPRKVHPSETNQIPSTGLSISPKSTLQEHDPQLWSPGAHKKSVPVHANDGHSSWSASSDKQLGSPGSVNDRIFPIRSVVSVDSTQTPSIIQAWSSSEHDYFPAGIIPPGAAGQDIAGVYRDRQSSSQSRREADTRPTPRMKQQQDSRPDNERSRSGRRGSISTMHSGSDRYGGGSRMQIFNDAASESSNGLRDSASASGPGTLNTPSVGSRNGADQDSFTGLVNARFKHIVTAEGHAVITGRDGDTLQRCEDEP